MKVLTVSRYFPAYHHRKGEPTFFMEKIWKQIKTGNSNDGTYSIWTKVPRQMKDGHWQIPHLWRDQMNDDDFTQKFHTIRVGNRWKVGDWFSPRIWSGKPYASKQIEFAPPIQIKKIWEFEITDSGYFINDKKLSLSELIIVVRNDGLSVEDFESWFLYHPKKKGEITECQILCWNEKIEY